MECLPAGFKVMVPALLILSFAWTLKAMTDSLGASDFVRMVVKGPASGFVSMLPAIIFLIAVGISFATGTSCGDHCSPISDTTIMSSAGAQCAHINHVTTQLPYALVCAAISFVSYIIAGFTKNAAISLAAGGGLMIGLLAILRLRENKKGISD